MKSFLGLSGLLVLLSCSACMSPKAPLGQTTVCTWAHGKHGAVSITYDDGIRTQFSQALPIMQRLHLPATFFVITGPIQGSTHPTTFIGRPIAAILQGTQGHPTDSSNFFERASAVRYLDYAGALGYYDRADEAYESGHAPKAYQVLDSLFARIHSGKLPHGRDTSMEIANELGLSWPYLKTLDSEGYEIASHTVTHEHLAIMDSANMHYELEASKQDILAHLGARDTFSCEVPFGIDDPRVMHMALPMYPALRNQMPDTFLYEINRGDPRSPAASDKPYVQWQRGPLSYTPLALMKSWVDTTVHQGNLWLVLVFHGIDSVGWEPLPHSRLDTYFQYIHQHEDSLWIAPFGDVARYMRERMAATPEVQASDSVIQVSVTLPLNQAVYDQPLSLKTYIPDGWKHVDAVQGSRSQTLQPGHDQQGSFVIYDWVPGGGALALRPGH